MKLKITLILAIVLLNSTLWAQNDIPGKTTIKVLSLNILHGATTKGDFDLDAIAKVIIEAEPDLVALQEVDFMTNRALKYDLATELGQRAKMASIFGKAMSYDGGEYGEAVLSKHSFLQTRTVALPFQPGKEPRAALEVVVILPTQDTIAFIGTHFDHTRDETDRIAQARKVNEVFNTNPYPSLLAGDLNAQPGSNTINILEEVWQGTYDKDNPAPTFTSDQPEKKIDYVMFYPKNSWKVISTEVICDPIASDHCGYLVTLELVY